MLHGAERPQQTFAFANVGKRTLSEHGFPLVGSVQISPATEHYETFVGRRHNWRNRDTSFARCKLEEKTNRLWTRRDSITASSNVKLYLNSEFYPYDDMNLDFENGKFAILYDMYAKFL